MDENKDLITMLLKAGYPASDIDHHNSDLYIYCTPLTVKVLGEWCEANGWSSDLVKRESALFSRFRDRITGRMMFDVAFQYHAF